MHSCDLCSIIFLNIWTLINVMRYCKNLSGAIKKRPIFQELIMSNEELSTFFFTSFPLYCNNNATSITKTRMMIRNSNYILKFEVGSEMMIITTYLHMLMFLVCNNFKLEKHWHDKKIGCMGYLCLGRWKSKVAEGIIVNYIVYNLYNHLAQMYTYICMANHIHFPLC